MGLPLPFGHLVEGRVKAPHRSPRIESSILSTSGCEAILGFRSVLILSTFSTVVSYIYHQGGTHSISLCLLSLDLLTWCRQKEFLLSTYHVAGDQNFRADFIQRKFVFPSEWTLFEDIFDRICLSFGRPEVDLFVSVLIFRFPRYCSRSVDSYAWTVNAFSFFLGGTS